MTIKQQARNLAPDMDQVIKYMVEARDDYRSEGDQERSTMRSQDAKNMRRIRSLLRQGKVKSAYEKASSMDTEAQAWIPDSCWFFMQENWEVE